MDDWWIKIDDVMMDDGCMMGDGWWMMVMVAMGMMIMIKMMMIVKIVNDHNDNEYEWNMKLATCF